MESGPTPNEPVPKAGEIVLYRTEDGRTRVECRFVDETRWLSQALIGELFQKDVRREGVRDVEREIEHYNLDAILAVGYRVRSERGTQFRRWATERLRDYLVKGSTMDDRRLKNPPAAGSDVPDYLRVRDIFALVADYDPSRIPTTEFFQLIQNKLHFAATGKTAAELIAGRADHAVPNMGLTGQRSAVSQGCVAES